MKCGILIILKYDTIGAERASKISTYKGGAHAGREAWQSRVYGRGMFGIGV
jgi:hypothetical protein